MDHGWNTYGKAQEYELRQTVSAFFYGDDTSLEESPFTGIVAKYYDQKFLASLGYTFEARLLSDFELFCFRVIEKETAKLRNQQAKSAQQGDEEDEWG